MISALRRDVHTTQRRWRPVTRYIHRFALLLGDGAGLVGAVQRSRLQRGLSNKRQHTTSNEFARNQIAQISRSGAQERSVRELARLLRFNDTKTKGRAETVSNLEELNELLFVLGQQSRLVASKLRIAINTKTLTPAQDAWESVRRIGDQGRQRMRTRSTHWLSLGCWATTRQQAMAM